MAGTLLTNDYDDMVIAALRQFDEPNFIEMVPRIQKYEVMKLWLGPERYVVDDGRGLSRIMVNRVPDSARFVGLYEKDVVDVQNILAQFDIDWVMANNYWTYDISEIAQLKADKVVDLVEAKRTVSVIGLAKKLEEAAWNCPAFGTTKEPLGIPYWITSDTINTPVQAGFNGGAPSGYTLVGGINPTNEAEWRNYTDTYSQVSRADLFDKMERTHWEIGWEPPTESSAMKKFGQIYRIYQCYNIKRELVKIAREQNDDLGPDLAKFDGNTVFHKSPIVANRELERRYKLDNTDAHQYFVNHDTFGAAALASRHMVQSGPEQKAGYHNVRVMWLDTMFQFYCWLRRMNAKHTLV